MDLDQFIAEAEHNRDLRAEVSNRGASMRTGSTSREQIEEISEAARVTARQLPYQIEIWDASTPQDDDAPVVTMLATLDDALRVLRCGGDVAWVSPGPSPIG